MKRVCAIKAAGHWDATHAVDCITLDAHDRHRRRFVLTAERGTEFLLDLPEPTLLHDGDGLLLDDGTMVRIVGRREPLVEIAAANASELARLAWHIGNRHVDVQIVGERLRIRRDPVIEDMLRRLGAELWPLEAAFEPEHGAYRHDGIERGHDRQGRHSHE
jgi:urease accessory protein